MITYVMTQEFCNNLLQTSAQTFSGKMREGNLTVLPLFQPQYMILIKYPKKEELSFTLQMSHTTSEHLIEFVYSLSMDMDMIRKYFMDVSHLHGMLSWSNWCIYIIIYIYIYIYIYK